MYFPATNRGLSQAAGLADEEARGASLRLRDDYGHRLEAWVGRSSMDGHGGDKTGILIEYPGRLKTVA